MAFLSSIVSFLMSVVFLLSSLTSLSPARSIIPLCPGKVQLCVAAISDTHVMTTAARKHMMRWGFTTMSDRDVDAVIISGDITDHGRLEEYKAFYSSAQRGLFGPQLIPAVGNHDTWANDDESIDPNNRAPQSLKYFMDSYNEYSGRSITEPYYTTVINGYSIICMSTLSDNTSAYIPDTEIEWLDQQLSEATAGGLPAFVICHWPINGVNGQDEIWPDGVMGEQSDAVEAVLKKYQNVFYISGHVHAGFMGELTDAVRGYKSIETRDGVNYINLPCFMYLNTDAGNLKSGCGYIIEVYEESVVFRARNMVMQRWMPEYNRCIELV